MNSIENHISSLDLSLLAPQGASGFPSPADNHLESSLDLNQYLVKHPAATFFMRASGASMQEIGILNGDLLIVDRSLTPQDNSIVVATCNGDLMLKRLKIISGKGFLYVANKNSQPIAVDNIEGFQIWGVVTHAIHDVCTN